MKRISLRVFVILIFTMVLSMVFLAINPNMTKAEVITSSDGKWEYEKLEDNTIKITDIDQMDRSQTLLEIPEQIDGLTVSSIDLSFIEFSYDKDSSSSFEYVMKIPKTINNIEEDNAFGGNKINFRRVIGFAVSEENNTYKAVDGVIFSKDGKELIKYPSGKISQTYTIPEGVEKIRTGAFRNVCNTHTLIFSSTMKSLGSFALADYYCLTTLDIKNYNGEAIKANAKNVFSNDTNLKEFIIDRENTAYSVIDGVLFNKEQNLIIKYPCMKKGETYTIPKGVDILEGCFEWNNYLKSVNIESNITEIPDYAFYRSNITSIVLPNTVKKIGFSSFWMCKELESIVLPDGVKEISGSAFNSCSKLKTINIPNGVTRIGNYAFSDCIAIESINIPNGVTRIEYYTFSNCRALKSINIPASVTKIDNNAFIGCSNFTVKCEKNSFAYEWAMENKESKKLTIEVTDTSTFKCESIIAKTADGTVIYSKTNGNVYYTITFSEDVVEFTKDDIEVTNGTKGTFTGSGKEYILEVIPVAEGEQIVKIPQGACTDSAGNEIAETVKKVVIDRTGPVGSVSYSTTEKTGSAVVAKISANEEMQEIEGWTLSADKKELTKSYEDNTEETVTIKDLLGNESSVTIKISNIDKTLPKGEVTYSTAEYTNQDVTVTINVDKQVQVINGWTLSENKKVLTKKYTQNTEETVTITDLAGNRSIVTVKIANIDKEAPVIGEITLSTKEITNQDVEITVNATDAISGIEGYSWDEKQTWNTVNKVNAKTNGIYTIYVKDKAGNISSKTIKITNINKEPEKLAISATKYKVDGNYIINIKPETKVSEVKNDVKSNREYEIQKTDGTKLTENDIVATGYKVKFATGETYEIVVNGDVSGDGKITITDVAKIKKHIISLEKLTGAYLKAGDVNENDTVTVTDLAKIKKVIIGLVNL